MVIDRRTDDKLVLSAGDCLVGLSNEQTNQKNDVRWANRAHTADVSLMGLGETSKIASDFQHLLTRSINAKRFMNPEVSIFSMDTNGKLILVTDGYWRECGNHLDAGLSQTADDASCLTLF